MRILRRALGLAAVVLLMPAVADARSGYCSPTGDYCLSAKTVKGQVRLQLGTASFRGKVDVCVTAPDASRTCKPFTLRRTPQDIYEIDARWSAHFPRKGAGTYAVTFTPQGNPALPGVTFFRRS